MKKILVFALLLSIYGCATYTTTTEGTLVHENMVANIETGVTTREWIIDLLGEPTKRSTLKDGKEKLLYIYNEKSVPKYLFGMIKDESNAVSSKTELEVVIKDDTVFSYKYENRVK